MKNEYEFEHKVRYYETDKMGVTHHANYIHFMEESRIEFLERINCSYDKMEKMGVISPVIALESEYKKSTTFNDVIKVVVKLEKYNGIKFIFSYKMFNKQTSDLVFIGNSTHCFINDKGFPIIIKKTFPELDEIFNNVLENV